ncbi:MAG TPA: DedA family protein [Solirubrobacteraceae bacterium]|nr:DedA family protein [Solirubrobacteraceae bacterium]
MLATAALISVTSGLGYFLPALIGLESMGVPSPGETALVLAAVLASQGKLDIWLVIVIAAASAITGDNLGYLLGRHFGREVLVARGPFHERRAKVIAIGDRYFEKHGAKTVFIGRWLALIRFATAWLAGINGMRFRTFFCWNALSGTLWAVTYGLAGYYGGDAVAHVFEKVGIVAAVVLIVGFVAFAAIVKWRERRTERQLTSEIGKSSNERNQPPLLP